MADFLALGDFVKAGEPLARHCSLKVGGPAQFYAEPPSEEACVKTLQAADDVLTILGGGTNVLIADRGISGLVLNPRKIAGDISRESDNEGERWTVGAGVTTVALVKRAVDAGLAGAEVLAGVPGSVGGAVFMNAGGHEGEIKDTTEAVRVVTKDGARWMPAEEAGFSYRRSAFAPATVIAAVRLRLKKGDKAALQSFVKDHMQRRQKTQPLSRPNAGSFFKNPPGAFAGKLIEACGLKGFRLGGAEVSRLHANFLVGAEEADGSRARATGQDFVKLIAHVRKQVQVRFSVWLELEVRPLGDFSPEEKAMLYE